MNADAWPPPIPVWMLALLEAHAPIWRMQPLQARPAVCTSIDTGRRQGRR